MLGFGFPGGVQGVDCCWGGGGGCSYFLYVLSPPPSLLFLCIWGCGVVLRWMCGWLMMVLTGTQYDASPALRAKNPDCEKLFLESVLTARCFENTCGVVFANAAGENEGDGFLGLSRVTMPGVGVVGSLGWEEGVCVVDLDIGLIRDAEENYRVREDLGREGWYYSYRHQGRE